MILIFYYFSDTSAKAKLCLPNKQAVLNVLPAAKCSSSSLSSAPSSPNGKINSTVKSKSIAIKNLSEPLGSRDNLSRISLTPSQSSQVMMLKRRTPASRRGSRSPSPSTRGVNSKSVPHINMLVDSTDSDSFDDRGRDKAFVVLDDRYQNREFVRHNLYKEQKWMPSWSYSFE